MYTCMYRVWSAHDFHIRSWSIFPADVCTCNVHVLSTDDIHVFENLLLVLNAYFLDFFSPNSCLPFSWLTLQPCLCFRRLL